MIKQVLSLLALTTISVAPAMAELRRLGGDLYSAIDAKDNIHYITYVRRDHEGDVQVKVEVNDNVVYYWVKCNQDRISIGGDNFNGWHYVDHRKMEGYYSDVACRM